MKGRQLSWGPWPQLQWRPDGVALCLGSGLDPELNPGVGLVYNGREVGTCFSELAPDRSHPWSLYNLDSPLSAGLGAPGLPRLQSLVVVIGRWLEDQLNLSVPGLSEGHGEGPT